MHVHPFRPRPLDALYGCGRQRDGLTLCLCKAEPGGLRAWQRTGCAPT